MMVVSLSSEANAVGAIGMTGSFINLVVNIFTGFATGATVVIARNIGAKDDERVSKSVHTALLTSVLFGLPSAALGIIISRPILSGMGAQGNLLELATTYTFIYFCGVPFIALTNYLISIFRAKEPSIRDTYRKADFTNRKNNKRSTDTFSLLFSFALLCKVRCVILFVFGREAVKYLLKYSTYRILCQQKMDRLSCYRSDFILIFYSICAKMKKKHRKGILYAKAQDCRCNTRSLHLFCPV